MHSYILEKIKYLAKWSSSMDTSNKVEYSDIYLLNGLKIWLKKQSFNIICLSHLINCIKFHGLQNDKFLKLHNIVMFTKCQVFVLLTPIIY